MELIKNFGLDPYLFVAQIINFLIVLYLLKRFLYKPMFEMLKKREATIKDGLEKARESELLLEKAGVKEKEILKKAQEESIKLIDDAKKQQLEIQRETMETTKKQVESMLADAREQIELERRITEKKLTSHIGDLTILFLQKSLSSFFTQKEQDVIIKNAVAEIKKRAD